MGPNNLINCNILFFICGINGTTGINAKFFHQGMHVVILANKNDIICRLYPQALVRTFLVVPLSAVTCLSSKGL